MGSSLSVEEEMRVERELDEELDIEGETGIRRT